jgi:hypothetical protein
MSIAILGVDLGKTSCSMVGVSILAVGSPTRPYTLAQTNQIIRKSHLQTGRAIRSFSSSPSARIGRSNAAHNPVRNHDA